MLLQSDTASQLIGPPSPLARKRREPVHFNRPNFVRDALAEFFKVHRTSDDRYTILWDTYGKIGRLCVALNRYTGSIPLKKIIERLGKNLDSRTIVNRIDILVAVGALTLDNKIVSVVGFTAGKEPNRTPEAILERAQHQRASAAERQRRCRQRRLQAANQ